MDITHAIADGTATAVEHSSRIAGYATTIGFLGERSVGGMRSSEALIGATPGQAS